MALLIPMQRIGVVRTFRTERTAMKKWDIALRDDFTCQYCGDKPGSAALHVDHMIPTSVGGSDDPHNLVLSCKACNTRKNASVSIPKKMLLDEVDAEGWHIWKRWGKWSIRWSGGPDVTNDISVCGDVHSCGDCYWFSLDRVWELDWEQHVSQKNWSHELGDFCFCLAFARSLMSKPIDSPRPAF
jgi:hypothetical protein